MKPFHLNIVLIFLSFLSVAFAQGDDPQAEASQPSLSCVACDDGTSFLPQDSSGNPVGQYCYDSKKSCETSLTTQTTGWICAPGPNDGEFSPYSVKDGSSPGNYYFDTNAQCLNALSHIKDGLICISGPNEGEYGVYDTINDHFAERFYHSSLTSCFLAESSASIATSRNAQIPTGAVENCEDTVRLDSPGGSMEHVSVRNQGDEGICYAETAAESTDAWRFTHGDTQYDFATSSLIVALQNDNASGDWELSDGGDSGIATGVISNQGACDKTSTLENLGSDKVDDLVSILQDLVSVRKKQPSLSADDLAPLKEYFAKNSSAAAQGYLPDENTSLQLVESANPHKLLSAILEFPCKGTHVIPVKMPVVSSPFDVYKKDPLALANYLTSKMQTAQSLPVTVSVCGDLLNSNPSYRQIFDSSGSSDCDSSLHSMLLIGKRKNPTSGRCELLLRNSWGSDCASAADNFSCDNGSLWIDADVATRAMYDVEEFGDETSPQHPVIHRRPTPRHPYVSTRRHGPTPIHHSTLPRRTRTVQ